MCKNWLNIFSQNYLRCMQGSRSILKKLLTHFQIKVQQWQFHTIECSSFQVIIISKRFNLLLISELHSPKYIRHPLTLSFLLEILQVFDAGYQRKSSTHPGILFPSNPRMQDSALSSQNLQRIFWVSFSP